MELIGLSGYARSGKNTAAAVLVEEFGFKEKAFADKLREVLLALDPIVDLDWWDEPDYGIRRLPVNLSDVIYQYGWDGYKETGYSGEIRRLLQRLGTDAGRNCIDDNIWVDATMNNLDDGKYVFTDLRFPNEYDAIKERGGRVWRITRKDVGPINDHPSETSLDNHDFDLHLFNNGSLVSFQNDVREIYGETL